MDLCESFKKELSGYGPIMAEVDVSDVLANYVSAFADSLLIEFACDLSATCISGESDHAKYKGVSGFYVFTDDGSYVNRLSADNLCEQIIDSCESDSYLSTDQDASAVFSREIERHAIVFDEMAKKIRSAIRGQGNGSTL
jgi:hypothetical protein